MKVHKKFKSGKVYSNSREVISQRWYHAKNGQLSNSIAARQELEQQSRIAFSILQLQSPPLLP